MTPRLRNRNISWDSIYFNNNGNRVKLPAITRSKQKSLGNRPDFVLDCHQPGAKLKLYDTLRDKYLKAFFVNHGVQEAMRKNGMVIFNLKKTPNIYQSSLSLFS